MSCTQWVINTLRSRLQHTGWSTIYCWADCLWMNNASLFLTGLTVFLMPVTRTHYGLFFLVCSAFGMFCGKSPLDWRWLCDWWWNRLSFEYFARTDIAFGQLIETTDLFGVDQFWYCTVAMHMTFVTSDRSSYSTHSVLWLLPVVYLWSLYFPRYTCAHRRFSCHACSSKRAMRQFICHKAS